LRDALPGCGGIITLKKLYSRKADGRFFTGIVENCANDEF
jgi:hypothetical protein